MSPSDTSGRDDRFEADDAVQDGWVRLARDGDEEAFAALVRTYQDRLFAIALRLTGNEDDARDVVQDAFLQAWQGLGSFRGDARFSTWITRIVINRCHNVRRGARPTEPLGDHDAADRVGGAGPAADTVVVARGQWDATRAAIVQLPFDQRTALVLHTFAGYSHAETARVLGIAESAAKVRVHRARKALLVQLRDWR